MAFLNPGDDEIIDRILLYEIESIQDMAKFNVGVDAASFAFAIIITTLQKGRNNGRTYYLQAESREDCAQLVSQLSRLSKAAAKRAETSHLFAKIRVASRTAYHSPYFQEGTALLILAVSDSPEPLKWQQFLTYCLSTLQNFVTSVLDAQYSAALTKQDGSLTSLGRLDATVNSLFTFAFATELLFNIFANFSKRFFRNGWNWFDVIIVLVSLAGQGLSSFPDWLVKLMRAFRVIRLFGRVKALKTMITAVTASIVPMMNAFVILIILLCICACRRRAARARGRRLSLSSARGSETPPAADPASAQTRSSACRSSPPSPPTTSASSPAPSSPCSASPLATRGPPPSSSCSTTAT